MFPTREEALKLIRDGLLFNPGPWGKHCLTAAHCAEKIASACGDMDVEKAYILGLLHDIGRKFGVRHLGHVYDGYVYMKSLGYDEAAKICLTHSFNNHTIDEYIGKFDVTDEELTIIKTELAKTICWRLRGRRILSAVTILQQNRMKTGSDGMFLSGWNC